MRALEGIYPLQHSGGARALGGTTVLCEEARSYQRGTPATA